MNKLLAAVKVFMPKNSMKQLPQEVDAEKNLSLVQKHIMKCFFKPRCDSELIESYRQLKYAPIASDSGIRSRRKELVDMGLLEHSGKYAITVHGRKSAIYQRKGK